jgi:hypothetical protein
MNGFISLIFICTVFLKMKNLGGRINIFNSALDINGKRMNLSYSEKRNILRWKLRIHSLKDCIKLPNLARKVFWLNLEFKKIENHYQTK